MKAFENIHLYPTPFTNETRVLRVTKSLVELGFFNSILVVASFLDESTSKEEQLDKNRSVLRIKSINKNGGFLAKLIYFCVWYFKVLLKVDGKKLKCINAHSISVLPLGVLMKIIYKARLVYDAHEIETETQEVKGIRRLFSKIIERLLVRYADIVILTSQGHADWYSKEYDNLDIKVVRNCPYIQNPKEENKDIFRNKFGISKNELIFIYQGALSKPRGVDLILNSFKEADKKKHIVFMGFGDLVTEIKHYSSSYPNIHFHEAVHPDRVFEYTRCADVGIHMMDDSCKNHLYALPNKPMEYMNSGLASIVTNLPTMGELIHSANSGWLLEPNDEEGLKNLVNSLTISESKNSLIYHFS